MPSAKQNPTINDPKLPSFDALSLSKPVQRAIVELGYRAPTAIQVQAIPVLLAGRDLIASSQTGTGKTAAFALPILTRLKRPGALRALILEPTRELARQVHDAFVDYMRYTDMTIVLLQGGVRYDRQRRDLQRGADVIVATPGRLLDFLNQGEISLKRIETLVLDEGDRMLDMGFIPDVRRVVRHCPRQRQSVLFSATISDAIDSLSRWMLNRPAKIVIGRGISPAETIEHAIYPVDERQKFDLLVKLLEKLDYQSVIIFARTKAGADCIARWLKAAGHTQTAVLHANRSQKEREQALKSFKNKRCPLLVATDIASRGIDISDVSHVINFDIPQNPEDYVHRIGRTGRMHAQGDAVTFCTAADTASLHAIEALIDARIPKTTLNDFNYRWTPILENTKPQAKRRNRGYSLHSPLNTKRRRRR